ncbi:hypothetical protein HZH66_003827 [Vespula vulgaris]|uniref:Uncharacterized protein n=1 Tax=Vespula vulgaris TaxID=7454 RepID=A0A834KFP2_VESVU|nr:hypothetical protein HZH66_003827 [Vespula vulgaris]
MPPMIVKNSEKEKTHWNVLEFVNGRGRGINRAGRQASRQAGWLAAGWLAGWLVGWLAGWLAGRHPFRKHFWKSPHVLGLRKSPNVRVACPHHEAPTKPIFARVLMLDRNETSDPSGQGQGREEKREGRKRKGMRARTERLIIRKIHLPWISSGSLGPKYQGCVGL